jgi:type VI secretion system protein ImpE
MCRLPYFPRDCNFWSLKMTAAEHFQAGRLNEAIDAQLAAVRSAPLDSGRRTFLFELLAFAGQWERAEQQLAVLAQETAEKGWGASVYQNLIAAEKKRQQVFSGKARPDVFVDPPPFVATRWEALEHLSRGTAEATAAGTQKLAESDAAAPALSGTVNDQPVSGLRDMDDLLAPILEVMLLRDYVWVPWSQIRELEVEKPAHPRDLLWVPARMVLTDGEERRAYLPALYPDTGAAATDDLKLGRMTDWVVPDNDGPVRGVGQHVLAAGDRDFGLLEIRKFVAT